MEKRHLVSIAAVVVCVGALYWALGDHLPPRSPRKVARLVTGLSIPPGAEVVSFNDQWNVFGDGLAEVEFALDPVSFETLKRQAAERGYRPLSAMSSDDAFVRSQVGDAEGLYRFNRTNKGAGYELTVLNNQTRHLLVRVLAP